MAERIAVIGAGSWGTAISRLLGEKGHDVLMWAFEPEVAEGVNKSHRNPLYLSDMELPSTVSATGDLSEALSDRRVVISVVPSHVLRKVWQKGGAYLDSDSILLSCTKGIETTSLKLMSQVLSESIPRHPASRRAVLSGPSFAREVAAAKPTSVVIAGESPEVCKRFQDILRTPVFLTFTHGDVTGVEVGGAVKNVIAIASGIIDGVKLGFNARASLITRGLYEMIKIGKALGANPLTFTGLSGVGDLVLTCTEGFSRNHMVGKRLGEGQKIKYVIGDIKNMGVVAEGIPTAKAVEQLIERHGINAPICTHVYEILFKDMPPKEAIEKLCSMELKDEMGAILK